MYVAAQNTQAQSLLLQGGTAWNVFLMQGTPPEDMETFPFQLNSMDSIFANAIAGIRVNAVNNATYGNELLVFEHVNALFQIKMHGARSLNGVAGIQCIPQAITTNIEGLEKPGGYVNGLSDLGVVASATTHLLTDKYIEFDLGTPCSIEKVSYGNLSSTNRNPTSFAIQYFDGSDWVDAVASVAAKTYVAAGIDSTFTPITARLWRIKYLNDTLNSANPLGYRFVRFIASELPGDVLDKSNIDMTWAIAVPASPILATYESADATQIPGMIMEAGGPIDGKPVVLNRRRAGLEDPIAMVHCKVFGGVVQELP